MTEVVQWFCAAVTTMFSSMACAVDTLNQSGFNQTAWLPVHSWTYPGGGYRAWHVAVFGVVGAGLTALGFGIGADAWFIIAIAVAARFHQHARITSYTWAQVLAWAGGSALWIVVTFIAWLIRGRQDRPSRSRSCPATSRGGS